MSEGISGWAIGALAKTLASKILNALPTFLLRRLVTEADFKSNVVIAIKHAMPVAWLRDNRPSHGISGLSFLVVNLSPMDIDVNLEKITIAVPPTNLLTQNMSESSPIPAGKSAEVGVDELPLTDQQVRFLKSKEKDVLHIEIKCLLRVNSRLHSFSALFSTDLNARIDATKKKARR